MKPVYMAALMTALCILTPQLKTAAQTIYVPQSAPYTNDAYTVLLEHFDGTTTGAITGPVTYTNGIFGQGAFLNFDDCIVYSMGALSQGTVEFWADADSFTNNPDLTFVTAALWPNNWSTFVIGVGQTNYVYSEYVDVNDVWQGMGNGDTSKSVTTNSWHHYATTWGGNGFHFYVDGYLVYSNSATGGQFTETTSWQVGANSAGGNLGNGFNGIIDELRISSIQRVFAPASAPTQPPFLTNGLVAYYPLNRNANDMSGNGNNGIIQGAIFTPDRFGNSNNALYFDGTDRVVVQDSPSLNPTNAITLSAWFNANNLSGNGRIINKGELQYQMLSEWGNFSFEFVNTSDSDFKLYTTPPTTGTWHQAVETYDGSTMNTYIDGMLAGSQPASGFILPHSWSSSSNNNLNIGNQANNPVGVFDAFFGSINDVRIYNVALSSNQVAQLYTFESTPAPTITTQPQSTTNNLGDTVSFSVGSTNTVPLTYQWYFDNNPVNGATNSNLTTTNVQQESVGQYYAVVSDFEGSTTSSVANLNIPGVPCWINNGLVAYYPFNGNANDMSGNGNNGISQGGVSNAVDRFGVANQAYGFNGLNGYVTIPNSSSLVFNNSYSFTCWVFFNEITRYTSGYDWQALFTKDNYSDLGLMFNNEAGLLRDYASGSTIDTAWPTVSAQTWHQVVVTVTGQSEACYLDGSLSSRGTLAGSVAGNTNQLILGASNPEGTILAGPPYPLDGSLDDVRIYNTALSSNQVAQLYAFETSPASITNQPQTVTNNLGDTVVLSIGASGGNPQDFTWYFLGTNIDNGSNSTLTIPSIAQPYFGNYYVVVTNAFSSVTSSIATIFEPATIIQQPANIVVPSQAPATFSVQAVGYPAPTYQWVLNGTNLTNGANIGGAQSNTLTISNLTLANTGNYQVLVSNAISATNSTIATLNMSPSIYTPFLGATPIWGQTATLSVGAIGSGTLTYQWYFNGQPISGANYPQLNFNSIQFTNNGFYSCVITSPYGSVTNVAEQVAVNPAVVTLGFYPGLTINGATGDSYIIQSSSNLANTNNWTTLTNLTLTQPVQLWFDASVDASSPLNNQFFYRLIPQQ